MSVEVITGLELAPLDEAQSRAVVDIVLLAMEDFLIRYFGSREMATRTLPEWMAREDSEFWLGRSRLAVEDGRVLAACFSLPGAELQARRMADHVQHLRRCDRAERMRLVEFIRDFGSNAVPVSEGADYLDALGVLPQARRRGLGATLLEDFIERGRKRGVGLFELAVEQSNLAAIALYDRFGFVEIGTFETEVCGLNSQVRQLNAEPLA